MIPRCLLAVLPILSLIFHSSSAGKCEIEDLKRCTCGKALYDQEWRYVVNCTNTRFQDTEMLKALPEDTEVLIFTGNFIRELPWNIFGFLKDLKKLRDIDMSNNGIHEIPGKSYHHVQNVERLILNHNNITISEEYEANYHHPRVFSNFVNLLELHLTDAFADNTDSALANDLHDIFVYSNLSKLYKLHLEQNEIRGFRDRNVFCELPSLRDLYLGDNYLPGLSFNINCLKKLKFIDLERNNISRLTSRELDQLDRMSFPVRGDSLMIDISNNPFKCDSSIKNLYVWMRETNVTIRNKETLSCRLTRYGSTTILNLKSFLASRHAKVSRAITVLLGILTVVLISLLAALAYLSREKIKEKIKPLLDVSRKVQYTTIESQDV